MDQQPPPTSASRVQNSTTLDTAWLQRLVDAVTPEGLSDFAITFLRGDEYRGSADGLTRTARIWIGADLPAGYVAIAAGTSKVALHSLAEVAVFLTAHELRHLWQYDRGERPNHRDPEQCALERGANAYGARMLRRYGRGALRASPRRITGQLRLRASGRG